VEERFAFLSLIFLISAGYLGLAVFVAIRGKGERTAAQFVLLLLSLFEWTFAYGAYLAVPLASHWKSILANLQYLGATLAPVHFFLLVLLYQGGAQRRLAMRELLLFLEPAVMNVLIWTDSYHHLYRRTIGIVKSGGFEVWAPVYGPLLYVTIVYGSLLLVAATVLLLTTLRRYKKPKRPQAVLLVLAAFAPWAGNLLDTFGVHPTPIDFIHFGFFITVICLFIGLIRYRLFLIGPRQLAERILDAMSDFVLLVDAVGGVQQVNPAFKSLLGFAPDELKGRSWERLLAAPPPEALLKGIALSDRQLLFLNKSGKQVHVSLSVTPFTNELSEVQGYLLVGRDMGERLRLEEERMKSRRLEAIRQLAAGVAHDFNNILTSVSLNSETLARRLGAESVLCALTKNIDTCVKRASAQAERLLLFSGQIQLHRELLDLNLYIRLSEAVLCEAAGGAGRLQFDLAAEKMDVWLDSLLFRRAVGILVSRVARNLRSGTLLRLSTLRQTSTEASIRIEGFPMDWDQDGNADPFDPYSQSSNAISTDLEMAMAQGIVLQHEGRIFLQKTQEATPQLCVTIPLGSR
jgi:PAS domain S-box-containing protein